MTEAASLIKNALISEGDTKHRDLDDGNNLDLVAVAPPVDTTTDEVRANDPSEGTNGHNPFVGAASICLLVCIVKVYLNPEEWIPITLSTLNLFNMMLPAIFLARRIKRQEQLKMKLDTLALSTEARTRNESSKQ
jgi:hypothetical protein